MEGEMHRTRPGGLNGGEMYRTRPGSGILLLLLIRNHTGLQVLHSYNTLINTETIKANKNNLFIKHIIELILPLIKCDLHCVSIKSLPFLAFCLSVVCLSVS